MTRVTQSMLSRTLLADLADVQGRLARSRAKLSSGKELTRPSDDPFQVARALQYRSELAATRQYQRSIAEADSWQTVTDTALGSMGDALLRARELVVQAANGTLTADARRQIGAEIASLTDRVKGDANARYAGRYVFSGTATLTAPYSTSDDVYHGDAATIQREIGPGVQLGVNVVGSAVVGDASSGVIKALRDIEAHLTANDQAALSADLTALDTAHETVITARTDVGARANRLEAATRRLQELEEATTSLLSETEDADMARTLVDVSTQQAVYESALRAGASIVQSSLLDFLD